MHGVESPSKPPSTRIEVQILLDTNFLVSLLRQHRDIEDEIRTSVPRKTTTVVLDLVVLELERLARQASSTLRGWATVSLEFIHRKKYLVLEHRPGPADVDSVLISSALWDKGQVYVATIDRKLKDTLHALGVPTISPKKTFGMIVEGVGF